MKEYRRNESRFKRFFTGKGFYIALFCCVAAAGLATWLSFKDLKTPIADDKSGIGETTAYYGSNSTNEHKAGANATSVPYTQQTKAPTSARAKETTTAKQDDAHTPYKSYYMLPIGNEITKEYSSGQLVYSKTMCDYRVHSGTDFTGNKGGDVKAINDGKVLSVTNDSLWGTVIEIDHGGGLVAKYCGLDKNTSLKKGSEVKMGDKIGILGEIPVESADGIHLHLEITVNKAIVDPMKAMGKGN